MLIRAMVTSIFLHLLILLTQSPAGIGTGTIGRPVAAKIVRLDPMPVPGGETSQAAARTVVQNPSVVRPSVAPTVGKRALADSGGRKVPLAFTGRVPPGEVSAATGSAPASDLLGQYRLELARRARYLKVYPVIARNNGWEGTVVIGIMLPARTGMPGLSLVKSSGYEVLDRQALAMLEQAVGQAVLPEGLRGQDLQLSLSVMYGEDD